MTVLWVQGIVDRIGTSHIVYQCAKYMADQDGRPVLMLDLDMLRCGGLARHAGVRTPRSFSDAARHGTRLYAEQARSYYACADSLIGLCDLHSEYDENQWSQEFEICMEHWKQTYPVIIIDAGSRQDELWKGCWKHCTHWSLVVPLEQQYRAAAVRAFHAWDAAYVPADRSGVIAASAQQQEWPLLEAYAEAVGRTPWALFSNPTSPIADEGSLHIESSQAVWKQCIIERHDSQSEPEGAVSKSLVEWIEHLLARFYAETDMDALRSAAHDAKALRQSVRQRMQELIAQDVSGIEATGCDALCNTLCDDILGLGPIEVLCKDPSVTEIMVNGSGHVYCERSGKLTRESVQFRSEAHVRNVIERIVAPTGRRVDERSPIVDTRLADGSRVNIVLPPLALTGPTITIRRFGAEAWTIERLCAANALTAADAELLSAAVRARRNVIIFGGTGSGKTTLLNALSAQIDAAERIITIEDAAELQLQQDHVVRLETRPSNIEGEGEVTIRELVRAALRMRPDRIIVGECRGAEALDMLQAMNTGHDGSMTTVHANSPHELIHRLVTLVCFAGLNMPVELIQSQIVSALDCMVHVARRSDGSRGVLGVYRGSMEGGSLVVSRWGKDELQCITR